MQNFNDVIQAGEKSAGKMDWYGFHYYNIVDPITEVYTVEFRLLCASDEGRAQQHREQTQISFWTEPEMHLTKNTP